MKFIYLPILLLIVGINHLNAQDLQSIIDAQALEIKQLKRALNSKEQELKILLLTLKNSKQRSMLHSAQRYIELKNLDDNISKTHVVVNPSMLSENDIKVIDYSYKLDDNSSNLEKVLAPDDKNNLKITKIKPSTFILIVNSKVYKDLLTTQGEIWSKGRRFTSNQKRGKWIQITGKITNRGWEQVNSKLWIKENDVRQIR